MAPIEEDSLLYIGRIPLGNTLVLYYNLSFDLILCAGIVVGYSLVHSKPAARHF